MDETSDFFCFFGQFIAVFCKRRNMNSPYCTAIHFLSFLDFPCQPRTLTAAAATNTDSASYMLGTLLFFKTP